MATAAGNIDLILVTETKIDSTFSESHFFFNGYKIPYRYDRSSNGGGTFIYTRMALDQV